MENFVSIYTRRKNGINYDVRMNFIVDEANSKKVNSYCPISNDFSKWLKDEIIYNVTVALTNSCYDFNSNKPLLFELKANKMLFGAKGNKKLFAIKIGDNFYPFSLRIVIEVENPFEFLK